AGLDAVGARDGFGQGHLKLARDFGHVLTLARIRSLSTWTPCPTLPAHSSFVSTGPPWYRTLRSGRGSNAKPAVFSFDTRRTSKVRVLSIPGKLPVRRPIVSVRRASFQRSGIVVKAPFS